MKQLTNLIKEDINSNKTKWYFLDKIRTFRKSILSNEKYSKDYKKGLIAGLSYCEIMINRELS